MGHERSRQHGRRHHCRCPPRASPKVTVAAPVSATLQPSEEVRTQRGRLSPAMAFVAVTAVFVLFAAAASAPTPLYVVYQKEWGFTATTLTVIFAVYVIGLIGSLLVVGALSDHVGRRPVLVAAIALEGAAFILFLVAGNVTGLLAARVAQGIATGAAFSTLGATLLDLNQHH